MSVKYRKSQITPEPADFQEFTLMKSDGSESVIEAPEPKVLFSAKDLEKIEFWDSFIHNEKFNETVLIATSVLDCGVNIHDDAVRDIVIFADDPTAFMQMLGRKRLSNDREKKVSLWVYIPARQDYRTQIQKKQLEIGLGKKFALVEKHTENYPQKYRPDLLRNVWKGYGQIHDLFYAKVEGRQTVVHEGVLDIEYSKENPGSNYKTLYRELWSQRQKITDKALFHIDRYGHITVSQYVLWVIEQQLAYYQRFVLEETHRFSVMRYVSGLDAMQKLRKSRILQSRLLSSCWKNISGSPLKTPTK